MIDPEFQPIADQACAWFTAQFLDHFRLDVEPEAVNVIKSDYFEDFEITLAVDGITYEVHIATEDDGSGQAIGIYNPSSGDCDDEDNFMECVFITQSIATNRLLDENIELNTAIARLTELVSPPLQGHVSALVNEAHGAAKAAGWWNNPITWETTPRCLMLIVSELSEAMEGDRKGLMDDKLPHRKMLEVELADALIRIADLAGALQLDLGGAVSEKLAYNRTRPDHQPEIRQAVGGKAY